ncbi:MAG: TonB-dependent receptor [Bacteroidota bacterium]
MKLSRSLLLTLLGLALTMGVVDVHAQGTRASISGTVVDEEGEPLPGANIIAVHEPSGTQYGASSQSNGNYNLRGLRVGGPYTVTASFVGYREQEETDINLQLGQERTLDFRLISESAELEEVRVIGERSAVISSDRTGASRNVSQEEIDRLPTINRSLTDFARLIPQSGGGNSLGGRNGRYNKIQVDGATLDDVFGLGDAVPGSQAGAQPISLDAIEEFNVDIAPYDVRSSGFTGGQINAITKSGTNEFTGSLRTIYRDEQFTGDLDGVGTGDFQEQYYIGTLGGPIIEDKLFFFVNGEFRRQSSPLDTQVGDVPGPNTFQVGSGTIESINESRGTSIGGTRELMESIQDIAENQYDFSPGGISPFSQEQNNEKFLAKIDWNINNNNRLTARHNYVNADDDSGLGRGRNSFDFSNRQYVFNSVQNSSTLQLNSTIGDNMFNEARVVYTRIRDQRDVEDSLWPDVSIDLNSSQSANMGIGRFNQANRLDQDIWEITNDFTYTRGDHRITVGTNNEIFTFSNLFIQDFVGQYEFRGFEYENADGETVEVDPLTAFERGQPSTYRLSYSLLDGEPQPEAEFTGMQFGLYVQDEWDATDDLTLTAGLRADLPVLPDEPLDNPDARDAFGRSTTNVASGNILWSPRVGLNYSNNFFGDEFETQIRGGTGIFSGRPPFVWISNQYSNTGVDFARLDVDFDPGEDFVDGSGNYAENVSCFGGSGDPLDHPRPGDCPGLDPITTTEINLLDDDFKYPQTWRSNLAIDQDLPFGFVGTFEALYSSSINEVVFENINLEQASESAYGRPLYGEARPFGSNRNLADDRFTNALLLKNTNKGYEYSLTAQLQRRVPEGISGSISYTYNRAEKVNTGTSRRAISNWQFNENVDINDPDIGTADFERRHRLLLNLDYRIQYLERFATSVGLIYEGRSGSPFSWIYAGDANADGQSFNDLVYVPETEDDIFLVSDNWDLMDAFIEGEEGLNEFRGGFADRNSSRDPWENILDMRINQEIATFDGQRVELTAVVENVLNLLNDDWGQIQFSGFNNNNAWELAQDPTGESDRSYIAPADVGREIEGRLVKEDDIGKPFVEFDEGTVRDRLTEDFLNTSNIASRWRLQLGVRYIF